MYTRTYSFEHFPTTQWRSVPPALQPTRVKRAFVYCFLVSHQGLKFWSYAMTVSFITDSSRGKRRGSQYDVKVWNWNYRSFEIAMLIRNRRHGEMSSSRANANINVPVQTWKFSIVRRFSFHRLTSCAPSICTLLTRPRTLGY